METRSRIYRKQGPFRMYRGGSLLDPQFAYETWGELNAEKDNAVMLFTGLSPSAHAASSPENPASGWWEDMIGNGLPLDTNRYFVICVNSARPGPRRSTRRPAGGTGWSSRRLPSRTSLRAATRSCGTWE